MRRRAMLWRRTLVVLALPTCALAQSEPASQPCAIEAPAEIHFDSSLGEVRFPHQTHVDMELPCGDCHHETLAEDLSMPHPEYFEDFWIECGICHQAMAEPGCPQECSVCHHGSPVTIADETLSSKVVVHRSCWECHPVGTGSEASANCSYCHRRGNGDEPS